MKVHYQDGSTVDRVKAVRAAEMHTSDSRVAAVEEEARQEGVDYRKALHGIVLGKVWAGKGFKH